MQGYLWDDFLPVFRMAPLEDSETSGFLALDSSHLESAWIVYEMTVAKV